MENATQPNQCCRAKSAATAVQASPITLIAMKTLMEIGHHIKRHEMLVDVLEYVAIGIITIATVVLLSDELTSPLWGALSDAHFR